MLETSVSISGATTFWSLSDWTHREMVQDGLEALGLAPFAPEPRTPAAALRDALGSLYTAATQLVRPLKTRDGFTVVEENRGTEENNYRHVVTAKIDKDMRITLLPYDAAPAAELVRRFNEHLGLIRAAQVSASLVAILDALGGTRLRPGGSVYWLPGHRLDEWQAVARVYETAGRGRPNNLYVMRSLMDQEAVRAVRDAITEEVRSEAERLSREIQSGELGERALEHRRAEAEHLRRKIRLYEELLSVGLDQLHHAVGQAENAAAVAALQLTVAPGVAEDRVA
jgi:hypothetical protein